ncbi:dTMP kinase [Helicobacter sp. 13S00401-1]|uniref:dTMP kinase n=1 Tax=Helicobacter sp. 13S00401-1 TaxID=1905758 RepID=UPI000BA642EB|nr:dTMP kinase [Helicobacter sp. 13S00401-1]PAF51762.1 dTMP kinase [Helicobacter sp. 13S00401-1]
MTYCVLEGIDCVGKSTQIGLLKKALDSKKITFISEPDSSPLGPMIRKEIESNLDHKTMFLLFLASRAALFNELRLQNPKFVISDRSLVSGVAYSDLDLECALELNLFATSGILPTKVVLLEISKDALSIRLKAKKQDGIEAKGLEYLLSVQTRLKSTLGLLEKKGVLVKSIDASKSIDSIHNDIKDFFDL